MYQLLIISHVGHYRNSDRLWAYGPYAREIARWAELFTRVVIAAPLATGNLPADAAPLPCNVSLDPQFATGGPGLYDKLAQWVALPLHAFRLLRAMRRADVIHVRCPGNLGFLGAALAPLFRKPRIAKYAGQWPDTPKEPLSWRCGKWLLRSRWWNAPVLVYGHWPGQPRHIIPFFTSVMDDVQMKRASAAQPRRRTTAMQVLFVGRLSSAKNVNVLLRAAARLVREGKRLQLTVVGDGPERDSLQSVAAAEGIDARVLFTGALPQEAVFERYEQAHVLVLASETEGWPKALSEGMAFATVCIGSNRGLVPKMLEEGRGLVVEPGSVDELAAALRRVYDDSDGAVRMAQAGANWSRRFTLDEFTRELRNVLAKQMGIAFLTGRFPLSTKAG